MFAGNPLRVEEVKGPRLHRKRQARVEQTPRGVGRVDIQLDRRSLGRGVHKSERGSENEDRAKSVHNHSSLSKCPSAPTVRTKISSSVSAPTRSSCIEPCATSLPLWMMA